MRIEEIRKDRGYTQAEVAEILGITQGAYSKKVKHVERFEVEEVIKLSILFNVTFEDMFKEARLKIEGDMKNGNYEH